MSSPAGSLQTVISSPSCAKGAVPPPAALWGHFEIGQYIMPAILQQVLTENPAASISMRVENTQHLLEELEEGEIQFALIEGLFDKTAYHAELFALEPFIGDCSAHSPLAEGVVSLEELTSSRLIVRERGSGTREILEHLLHGLNLSVDSFAQVTEIGNMEAIKRLVKRT